MNKNRVVKLADIRANCQNCSLLQLCLPIGLAEGDLEKLDSIIQRRKPVQKGDYLYHMGDPFKAVYAVRSGSFKTFTNNAEGEEQIISFYLPGELMGLDAISANQHICSARALETTSVCEIPYERLESLSLEIPGLQHHLLSMMSQEIQHDQCKLMMVAKLPAEGRLANFIINLSERFKSRGYAANDFNLSMSRNDIANLLGLAVETVSRILTHFQEQGLLRVERKHIEILDLQQLRQVSSQCPSVNQNAGDSTSHTA
ncbi:MAG: fumarate/nitrate reduction transcriptional regulator Fnr [Thioalkalispiraceae bacterium]|jgi:CRP/FNR family transcriptional regulator